MRSGCPTDRVCPDHGRPRTPDRELLAAVLAGWLVFVLTSEAFSHGQTISVKFTGDGENISPALHWSGVPKQAKELTRQEREEVYRRSLKAMGLKKEGPMTPAQRDLVQRMYRTMVLGESGNRPPN